MLSDLSNCTDIYPQGRLGKSLQYLTVSQAEFAIHASVL